MIYKELFYTPKLHYPKESEKYWSPELETMKPEKREKLIFKRIRAQVEYAYNKSALYHKKYKDANIRPSDIKTFKDFRKLPFITKQDLREDQRTNPPFGTNLCIPPQKIYRIHGTSGTTGKSVLFGLSRGDIARIGYEHARAMWGAGLRYKDMMLVCTPFSLYVGGWDIMYGCQWMGVPCFPFGAGIPGQTKQICMLATEVRPTATYSTISYAFYMAETARSMGYEPSKDFAFRIMFFSGEAGAGRPNIKKKVREIWNAKSIDCGTTAEMAPWMSNCECEEQTGMHLWQDMVYAEVIDPETKELCDYGEEGVAVYTHMGRESHPMIRFWSNDITRWAYEGCPCGRTYPTLPDGVYGRYDDMFKVRGVGVWSSAVENVLRGIDGFGNEFKCIVDRTKVMDTFEVVAEYNEEVAKKAKKDPKVLDKLKREMEEELRLALGVRCDVTLKPPFTIPRTEKHKRSHIVLIGAEV